MPSEQKIIFIETLADMDYVNVHYGSRVACCATSDMVSFLPLLREPGMPFLSFLLVTKGEMLLVYAEKEVKVKANDLLLVPPHAKVKAINVDDKYALSYLLLDPTYSDSIEGPDSGRVLEGGKTTSRNIFPKLYHLDVMKVNELMGIVRQIENAIVIPHLYMKEIMRSLIYVTKAFLAELDSVEEIVPHDFSHKENVFKIFLHLAATHFREHRQIDYYADRLCITNTYLSRIVREVSGKTVNNHLTQLLYDEACRLLSSSDTPLGQIAFDLHFNDQSAFSNFFKTKASMTPKAYRAMLKNGKIKGTGF